METEELAFLFATLTGFFSILFALEQKHLRKLLQQLVLLHHRQVSTVQYTLTLYKYCVMERTTHDTSFMILITRMIVLATMGYAILVQSQAI